MGTKSEQSRYRPLAHAYDDVDLATLGKALIELSLELRLLKPPVRTKEERQALADRAADLLAKAHSAVVPNSSIPFSTEFAVRGAPAIADLYLKQLKQSHRSTRWILLQRAAEVALGARAQTWVKALPYETYDSDEAVAMQLRSLDRVLEFDRNGQR